MDKLTDFTLNVKWKIFLVKNSALQETPSLGTRPIKPKFKLFSNYLGRAKRICYLSPMRAAKVQASLRIRAVSPEPSLLAHTSSESRGTFRQKARSLVPMNGWACAVKLCHDGMLEDTNSLGGAHLLMGIPFPLPDCLDSLGCEWFPSVFLEPGTGMENKGISCIALIV